MTLAVRVLRTNLPQGRLLPFAEWQKRHAAIVALLWIHAIGLACFAISQGYGVAHSIAESSIVAAAAAVAGLPLRSRKLRSAVASWGLITSSVLLVHFWNGAIEGHFHFFFVIGVLTLYQDWVPFLLALVYVVLHHGLMGAIDPASVYNHPGAVGNPWGWAAVHAVFLLAASMANVVTWRVNEQQFREPLTGLPGRTVFCDRLAQSLARLDRAPSRVAVIFVDLDRFKIINDSLGHAAGDQLLVTVAQRLRAGLRRRDSVARLGGDEFAILCEDVADEHAVIAVARRVVDAIARPVSIGGHEIQTTASLGIALTDDTAASPSKLMRDADVAMYRAKESGGGRWEVFDELLHARVLRRMETEAALRSALTGDQMRLDYQPELCLTTGRIVGVEALLRWERPGHGLVAPLDFIPLAEDSGLIVPIGTWVIEEACRQAQRWRAAFPDRTPLTMRVNLSPRQLAQPNLVKVIECALDTTGTHPSELDLELTESTMMGDIEWTIVTLNALKRLGLRLSVDDFGTGYSSLSYLKDFPVDTLKVDRSFITDLGRAAADSAIVASIIELAHALGLSVTAEGVEHEGQLRDLQDLGCDHAQGFLLARPQRAEDITALLAGVRLEASPPV